MARIKYADEILPLLNKHFGYTFQPNNYGQSMFPASRSARFRRPRQHNRQQNNQKAVTQWRNMSPETKAAWNLFASTYPQSTKRGVDVFLTGYQLFIKRNSYCFLNHGITSDFMLEPAMEAISAGETIFTLEAGDNVIDLTELYIANFGILPVVGQTLLFCAIPYSDVSGQFFAPIFNKLEVLEVFIDGFFLNLTLPAGSQNILYSVYLSKPVSAGMSYVGTKVRYMGCFTSKTFLGLTDTPSSYEGQAGKNVVVKGDESGLEFGEGGGGGLTCETLVNCPTIISILAQLLNLQSYIAEGDDTAIPPINYGLLYNWYSFSLANQISSSNDWFVPPIAQLDALIVYLGSSNVGGQLKEVGLVHWDSPNTGAIDSYSFHLRGGGTRLQISGSFDQLKGIGYIWAFADVNATYGRVIQAQFGSASHTRQAYHKWSAASIRLSKDAPGIADGIKTTYTGNNGVVYPAICINQKFYTQFSLVETLFRDGSAIPIITENAAWIADRTGAVCVYDNDWSNA